MSVPRLTVGLLWIRQHEKQSRLDLDQQPRPVASEDPIEGALEPCADAGVFSAMRFARYHTEIQSRFLTTFTISAAAPVF